MILPNFLIAGVERSGTTRLTDRLRVQPGIFMSATKELHFFDSDRHDLDGYAVHFRRADHVGEATPSYLFTPSAMERIARDLPGVRLVVILRNPIDRAWSHFWFRWAWRAEPRTFDAAVRDELNGEGFQYLARGLYHEQLVRAQQMVGLHATKVFLLEDLRDDEDQVVRDVVEFLGGSGPMAAPSDDFRNEAHTVRSVGLWRATSRWRKGSRDPWWLPSAVDRWNARPFRAPAMAPDMHVRLAQFFRDDAVALAELLGREEPRAWVAQSI